MVAEALADKAAKETKSAVVNVNTTLAAGASTTVELVPAVPGKRIVVTSINHVQLMPVAPFSGDWIGVVFKSGSDALTGELHYSNANMAGSTGYESQVNTSYMPDGHFKTASGEALNLTANDKRGSGGLAPMWARGWINYYEE